MISRIGENIVIDAAVWRKRILFLFGNIQIRPDAVKKIISSKKHG